MIISPPSVSWVRAVRNWVYRRINPCTGGARRPIGHTWEVGMHDWHTWHGNASTHTSGQDHAGYWTGLYGCWTGLAGRFQYGFISSFLSINPTFSSVSSTGHYSSWHHKWCQSDTCQILIDTPTPNPNPNPNQGARLYGLPSIQHAFVQN